MRLKKNLITLFFFSSKETCISEQPLYEQKGLHRCLRGSLVSVCFRKPLGFFLHNIEKKPKTLCQQIVVFFQSSLSQIQLGFEQGLTSPNTLSSSTAHAVFILCCYIKLKAPEICWCIKKYLPTFFQSMHSEGGSRPRGSHKAPGVSSWWALKLEGKYPSMSPALKQVLCKKISDFGNFCRII